MSFLLRLPSTVLSKRDLKTPNQRDRVSLGRRYQVGSAGPTRAQAFTQRPRVAPVEKGSPHGD